MPTRLNHSSSRYLILGLGQSGAAAARWCAQQGYALRLADTRHEPPQSERLCADLAAAQRQRVQLHGGDPEQLQWVLGPDALSPTILEGVQTLVLSPGLAPTEPAVAALLAAASAQGIECINELTLFARALKQAQQTRGYTPQVVAITGTNGKTTVASMVAHMLTAQGEAAQLAGNISPSLLEAWLVAEETQCWPSVWVVECSSFQLHGQQGFQPQVGALLNISQDHLDWHGSMAAYQAAKQRLLAQSQTMVINVQDDIVQKLAQTLVPTHYWQFGHLEPLAPRTLGICADNEAFESFCLLDAQGQRQLLLPVNSLPLMGAHQTQNALAALAIIAALGKPVEDYVAALANFQGAPHRCAWVGSIRDVTFINDSKGTNVGATVAALTGLAGPKVVIAGGLGKGQDFHPLAAAATLGQVQHWVLYGADAPLIARVLAEQGQPFTQVADLTAAVQQAFVLAKPQQMVLFSPACASMDQFKNYEVRGQAFIAAVEELALELGEVR